MSNGQENSQPENEMFPPESLTSGDPDEGKDVGDTGEKDLEPHEIPVPDEEDGLFAFGDDLEPPSEKPSRVLCRTGHDSVHCQKTKG